MTNRDDLGVEIDGFVAVVELRRPPHNYFDEPFLKGLADIFERLDADPAVRCLVLAAQGKAFCAGADFGDQDTGEAGLRAVYRQAARLFATEKPVIAAIQGAAVGGGLGLALVPDFRIVSEEARFSANFVKIGIHPGFALSLTLPRLIGERQAAAMFYTGRRVSGREALDFGLADKLVALPDLRAAAMAFAQEIAEAAPLAIASVRKTLRVGLLEAVSAQIEYEISEQLALFATADFREGVAAVAERRTAHFSGV